MKKKILYIVLGIFILTFVYFVAEVSTYIVRQKQNESMIEYCSQNNTEDCYTRMFELMLPELLLYDVEIDDDEFSLIKLDDEQSRLDSLYALNIADALIGYGVYITTNYEENYSRFFDKYSYTFDCGVKSFSPNHKKCLFFSECISTDKFLIFDHMYTKQMQTSSGKVHTFEQKLKELNLSNKKVFVKMDVAEADVVAIPEIIKNADNITGLNLALYINDPQSIIERNIQLKELNKKFVLIARNIPYRHTNVAYEIINSKYYENVLDAHYFYLSYINKDLLGKYSISFLQNTDEFYKKKKVYTMDSIRSIPTNSISLSVVIAEKVNNLFDLCRKMFNHED